MVKYDLVMCRQRRKGAIRGDHEQYIYIIRERFASAKSIGDLPNTAHDAQEGPLARPQSLLVAALLLVADPINRASVVV